jgi:hypothetical protein
MRPIALSSAQQSRLEKLARDAGRTPAQALRFVLRDGFDFCEWELRESLAADADSAHRASVPHHEVQRRARAVIAANGRRHRQAA